MRLIGDNARFGAERVDLSKSRRVMPLSEGPGEFPLGTAGLVPVLTARKDVSDRVAYAFAFDASDPALPGRVDAAYEAAVRALERGGGAPEDPHPGEGATVPLEAVGADSAALRPTPAAAGLAAADPDDPAAPEGLSARLLDLVGAVALVNRLLDDAYDLTGFPFGVVNGVQAQVTVSGSGFCRVEPVPPDGKPGSTLAPYRLCVETSEKPGSADSLQAQVIYDVDGMPRRAVIVAHDSERHACRVTARRGRTAALEVREVEETFGSGRRPRVLFGEGFGRRDARRRR